MKLRQLELFVAVAETGNYDTAAEKVFTNRISVYQAVRGLTRLLGVRLFHYKPSGNRQPMKLTSAGEHLLQNTRLILDTVSLTQTLITKVYDADGSVNYGSDLLAKETQPGSNAQAASLGSI